MKVLMENFRKYLRESEQARKDREEELAYQQRYDQKFKDYERSGLSKTKEAKYFGEAIAKLIENPKLSKDESWLRSNVGPKIGQGAYRAVYRINSSPEHVLKVGRPYSGTSAAFTNEKEKRFFNKYPEFMPKVFLSSDTRVAAGLGSATDDPRFKEDKHYADWIIVENVHVPQSINSTGFEKLEDIGYNPLIEKVFPGIKKAIDVLNLYQVKRMDFFDKDIKNYHRWEGGMQQFAAFKQGKQRQRKGLFELFVLNHSEIIKDEDSELRTQLEASFIDAIKNKNQFVRAYPDEIDFGFERFYQMIIKILTSDPKLMKFGRMMSEIGVEPFDVRMLNIGTRTGNEVLLIDISIFGA